MGEIDDIYYVSLSASEVAYACGIRQSIINYTQNHNETNFFDWLVASVKSINQVLENNPIEFDMNSTYINPLNSNSIHFKNFDLLISHHDLHEVNENSINSLIEKYQKRYTRLINIIKTKNVIYFIRYCKDSNSIEENEIITFFKNISVLNEKLKFKFILVSDHENLILPSILIENKNFKYINLNDHMDEDAINESNGYFKIIKKYKCLYTLLI